MKADPQHYHSVLAGLVTEANELLARMEVSVATFATQRPSQYYQDRKAAGEAWVKKEADLCRVLGKSNPPTYLWHKWAVDVRERKGSLEFRWQLVDRVRNRNTGETFLSRQVVKPSTGRDMNMNRLLGDSHESIKHLTHALEMELRDVRAAWEAIKDTRNSLNRILRAISVKDVDKRTKRLRSASSGVSSNPSATSAFDLIKVPGTGPKGR